MRNYSWALSWFIIAQWWDLLPTTAAGRRESDLCGSLGMLTRSNLWQERTHWLSFDWFFFQHTWFSSQVSHIGNHLCTVFAAEKEIFHLSSGDLEFPLWRLEVLGAGWPSPETQKQSGKGGCSQVREVAPSTASAVNPLGWLAADFSPRPLSRLLPPCRVMPAEGRHACTDCN